ncbi:pseudouridine synthase [Pseudooctadecabacter sp.]|uniref:pseudouridine synthase n=1 Tax=Pseudooctadecabacter sp. TaxID=1966338 RepID=UPI0035C7CFD8
MSDDMKKTPPGDRIAKVLARAGVASRREAEKIVEAGRVSVNGKVVLTPALNVIPKDRILVDGAPLAEAEPPRMWLYHKPAGLVTTERDEQGRDTVFNALPKDMPRVMSVGRLDLNSEGLLVLTNDGELKRKMELPATGWLRRYRVRIKGSLSEAKLDTLRKGIEVDGIRYAPMDVTFDRQQGANAWLTVGLREGKNREIRRVMDAQGVTVNRLIRISYGPFQLGQLKQGEVEEVKQRIVKDQMGLRETPKPQRVRKAPPKGKPKPRPRVRGKEPRP